MLRAGPQFTKETEANGQSLARILGRWYSGEKGQKGRRAQGGGGEKRIDSSRGKETVSGA